MLGTTMGSYRITQRLSSGAMGEVFIAEHTLLGRKAAVKLLLPHVSQRPNIVDRFFQEAKATAAIGHPGIVDIFDFGWAEDNRAYLVMEFLEGETLGEFIRRGSTLPVEQLLAILGHASSALAAAHAKGIIHRDLKPDNIFLVRDPGVRFGIRPKLLDFGIAKLQDGDGQTAFATSTGVVMGTPAYMSPEQCRGAGQVDHRADLYSLGCIFYELMCGRRPFLGEGAGELIGMQQFMEAPRPSTVAPGIWPEIEELIMQLLAKRPEARIQTATGLVDRLAALESVVSGGFRATSHMSGPTPSSLPGVGRMGSAALDVLNGVTDNDDNDDDDDDATAHREVGDSFAGFDDASATSAQSSLPDLAVSAFAGSALDSGLSSHPGADPLADGTADDDDDDDDAVTNDGLGSYDDLMAGAPQPGGRAKTASDADDDDDDDAVTNNGMSNLAEILSLGRPALPLAAPPPTHPPDEPVPRETRASSSMTMEVTTGDRTLPVERTSMTVEAEDEPTSITAGAPMPPPGRTPSAPVPPSYPGVPGSPVPTTLHGAASEWVAPSAHPPQKSRRALWLLAIAALLALVIGGVVSSGGEESSGDDVSASPETLDPPDAKQPEVAKPDAKQPDVKPPDDKQPDVKQPDVKQPDDKTLDVKQPDDKPDDKPEKAIVEKVTLQIKSRPSKALVYRSGDKKALGRTPLRISIDRSDEILKLEVRARGHHKTTLEVTPSKNISRSVTLKARSKNKGPKTDTPDIVF